MLGSQGFPDIVTSDIPMFQRSDIRDFRPSELMTF